MRAFCARRRTPKCAKLSIEKQFSPRTRRLFDPLIGTRMKRLRQFLAGGLLLSLTWLAQAQDPLLTNRATDLRAAPDDGAMVIKNLGEKSPVQLLERKSAWSKVKSDKDTGWVRMMHLRGGAVVVESASSGSSANSWFTKLLIGDSGRNNQRTQSATVGIRGFSKEDLAKAEFNPAEFEKLKRYQTSDGDAQRFATQGKLAFRGVAYLAQDAVDASGVKGAKK